MKPPTLFTANTSRPQLSAATVLISIFGFWLFYVAIVTLRASVMDWPAQGELALRRIYVTTAGIAITAAVWRIMRLFDDRPLAHRIIAAAFACIPAALAIALANYYVFNVYDQASLMDIERLRAERGNPPFWIEIGEVFQMLRAQRRCDVVFLGEPFAEINQLAAMRTERRVFVCEPLAAFLARRAFDLCRCAHVQVCFSSSSSIL